MVSCSTCMEGWGWVVSMKMICSHCFPRQLIIVMPSWLLIGTALHKTGTRTPAWLELCTEWAPGHAASAAFSNRRAPPSLGPGPGLDQRLHTRAGLLSPPASQAWSCKSKGRSCTKRPPIKAPALEEWCSRSYICETTGSSFQHSHHKSSMCRSLLFGGK